MVMIKVKNEEDKLKAFSILLKNGRFSGLSDNRFVFYNNYKDVLKKMRKARVEYIEEVDGQYWLKVNSDKGVDKVNENNNCMG